jgi:uncharacterized membrane protein
LKIGWSDAVSGIDRYLPRSFLGLGLPIGILYAFVLPPFQVPDETAHLARLYSVSEGVCVSSPDIDIPKSYADLGEQYPAWLERHGKISIGDLRNSLHMPANDSVMAGNGRQRSLDGYINQNLYPCLPYVPAAVVLNVGRRLGFSALALMYLSRLSNLAFYLLLTFFALRLLPDFRWVLFCVALLPMAMQQAASVSADSAGFALSFLLCAYVFRLAFAQHPEVIGVLQYAVLGTLILLVALSRSMLAVVVLPLVIPTARFGSTRNRWCAIVAYALLGVLSMASWQHVNRANFERLAEQRITRQRMGLPAVDVRANMRFLYEHPWQTASTFFHSITDLHYVHFTSREIVGWLGWLSVPLPRWLVYLYLGLLVLAPVTQTRGTNLDWPQRGLLLLFVAAAAANILAAGWVLETPLEVLNTPWHQFSVYTQGRYWIPLVFPALVLLTNTRIRRNPRVFAGVAVCIILIATAVAMHAIRATYYN